MCSRAPSQLGRRTSITDPPRSSCWLSRVTSGRSSRSASATYTASAPRRRRRAASRAAPSASWRAAGTSRTPPSPRMRATTRRARPALPAILPRGPATSGSTRVGAARSPSLAVVVASQRALAAWFGSCVTKRLTQTLASITASATPPLAHRLGSADPSRPPCRDLPGGSAGVGPDGRSAGLPGTLPADGDEDGDDLAANRHLDTLLALADVPQHLARSLFQLAHADGPHALFLR